MIEGDWGSDEVEETSTAMGRRPDSPRTPVASRVSPRPIYPV